MAMKQPTIHSPTDKIECKKTVAGLLKEKVISLDAEGVQLGKNGPLTLLQIGTLDGRVYLFDVMIDEKKQDKNFFKDTGLDKVLTSTSIVKVIQSCSGDSAALYHQFDIKLENVFDTQVAHLVIEEHKGRRLPSRQKLEVICKLYSENTKVYEGKDDVKLEWSKVAGNYWPQRPMTQTMIDYASGDVTALIPEVYETQKEYISKNQLVDLNEERVSEEIEFHIEPNAKEKRKKRNFDTKMAILENMAERYQQGSAFENITNEDEIKALKDTKFTEMSKMSDVMKDLKKQSMSSYLKSLEEELETPEEFNPDRGITFKLNDIERFGTKKLKEDALRIKQKITDVISLDVQRKYAPDEPLDNISPVEYQIIKDLKLSANDDPGYPPTVIALHWKIAATELKGNADALDSDPNANLTISVPKIRYFANNSEVPEEVKQIAQTLLEKYTQSMACYLKSLEGKLETQEEFSLDNGILSKLNDIERFGSEELKIDVLRIK